MKIILTTLCLAALACLIGPELRAGFADMEIHILPKQIDQTGTKASAGGSSYHSKEHWAYDVTIENKTFKQLDGLEMKYVLFSKHEKFGSKDPAEAKRKNGSVSVGSLKPHEKKSVTTTAVELTKTQLDGDYYFPTGGKEKAQDALVGLWVRIYQNGQQVSEYANPSTLTREKWE